MKFFPKILLFLLLVLFTRTFRASPREGIIQHRFSRLQQSGLLDLDDHSGGSPSGEDSTAPESGIVNNNSDNDADALSNNVRTFDPATTLAWVESYMQEPDDTSEEFWPDFTYIARSSSGNVDNEVTLIQSSFHINQGEEERFYKDLRNRLNNPSIGVYDSLVGIAFVTHTTEEPVSVNELFHHVYHLPGEYSDVHEVLHIQDETTIKSLGWEYYVGDNGIYVGPYCLASHEIDTEYSIEGGTIHLDTLIVDARDYRTRSAHVSYRGYLRLNDYFGVPPIQLDNINRDIPVEIRTISDIIRDDFDRSNPQFQIIVSPEEHQIGIELFMRNVFTLIEMQVPPPRGLSSLKYLSFDTARIASENGETRRVILNASPPDFDFVSQDISIENVGLELDYRARDRFEVTLNGTTSIDSVTFNTTITMNAQDDDYEVFMVDSENQMLSYSQISDNLIPSISTRELHLNPDVVSFPYLSNLQITQGGLHLTDPNVTMQFQPYMIYRIEGYHDVDEDDTINWFVRATYASLDGDVLVHYRYVFDYDESQSLVLRTFNIVAGDAATRGIVINQFSIDTYNRDFNFGQYEEYLDESGSGNLWRRGTRATIGVTYPNSCRTNSFCNFLRHKANITDEIKLRGYIKDPISTFSYDFTDTFITPFLTLTSPTIDLMVIAREEEGNLLKMRIRGDLQIRLEPDRYMYAQAHFLYFDEDMEHSQLHSESNSVYENLFDLDHLIDLIDTNFTGTGNFDGNLLRYNISSMSVLGRDCYSDREILDALTHQNDNTDGDASYSYSDRLDILNNFIDTENCILGRTNLRLRDEIRENSFYSYYNIQSVKRLNNIIMNSFDGEFLPEIIQEISMPSGVSVNGTYEDLDPNRDDLDRELNFIGNMNWYGLHRRGNVNAHIDHNYANLTLNLTSFSIGGGNLRFMTQNDFSAFLDANEGENIPHEINRFPGGDHNITKEGNTLNAGMEGSNLQESIAYLNANILIFDQFRRISVPVSEEEIEIIIKGKPFHGDFHAITSVVFTPEEEIEAETNSVVSISITDEKKLRDVAHHTRNLVFKWANQVINSFNDIQNRLDGINRSIENLNSQAFTEDTCPEVTRWESEPFLTCTHYDTELTCTHTRLICEETEYSCTEQEEQCQFSGIDGTCFESTTVCTRWEYTCVGDFEEVCVEYEDEAVMDECKEFGFVCEIETLLQPECIARSRLLDDKLESHQDDLEIINLFQGLTSELYDSVTEMVESDHHDGIVNIAYANSTQSLGDIRSGSEIIFTFGIRTFASWTRRYFAMIHSSELVNELEHSTIEEEESQDAGIIKLRTRIDFDSTERTARLLSTQIISALCDIYFIQADESRRIQSSLAHFGYLDGNSTLWPLYNLPSDPIHSSPPESTPEAEVVTVSEEPASVDEIYSAQGEEDSIFTYHYSYGE